MDTYKIGVLGRSHGLKGELSMQVDDDVFDRTDADYVFLELDGLPVPFYFEEYRFKSDTTCLVKFEGVDDIDRAKELTGAAVLFPRSEADQPTVIGYTIIDADTGKQAGAVADIDDTTANVMFVLTTGALLPAAPELITDVDHDAHTITLHIPEGVMEL